MVRPSSLLVKTAHKHNVHGLIPLLHVIPCLCLYKGLKMPQNIYLKRRNTGFIQRNKSYKNKFISVYDFNNPLQNKKHFTVFTHYHVTCLVFYQFISKRHVLVIQPYREKVN